MRGNPGSFQGLEGESGGKKVHVFTCRKYLHFNYCLFFFFNAYFLVSFERRFLWRSSGAPSSVRVAYGIISLEFISHGSVVRHSEAAVVDLTTAPTSSRPWHLAHGTGFAANRKEEC